MKYQYNPERLAYWYLRLNGFLAIENFIVHDEGGGPQRTDVDLIALRFPNRREAFRDYGERVEWMTDDSRFADKKIPFAAFVEVTSGRCKLNGPWTNHTKANMPRAIMALGAFSTRKEVDLASKEVYTTSRRRLNLDLSRLGAARTRHCGRPYQTSYKLFGVKLRDSYLTDSLPSTELSVSIRNGIWTVTYYGAHFRNIEAIRRVSLRH
jgi:hypothetical protein